MSSLGAFWEKGPMKGYRPPPSLENLAHYIATAVSTEATRDLLREEILRERFGVSGEYADLTVGILRYLSYESDLHRAVRFLVADRRTMAALANELAIARGKVASSDDVYCDPNASMEMAMEKVLEALDIPLIRWPSGYEGVHRIRRSLGEARQSVEELTVDDRTQFKHFADLGWGYLDTLIQVTINFYGEVFGASRIGNEQLDGSAEEMPETLGEERKAAGAFGKAYRADSLNKRINAIRHIGRVFENLPETSAEREMCLWHFGRSSPFDEFLEGEVEIDLAKISPACRKSLDKFRKGTSKQHGVIWVSRFDWFRANVDFYRNFYSHSNRKQWEEAGISMVRASLESASEIIHRLDTELSLCPVMIVPVEEGSDGYGRRMIYFVREHELGDDGSYSRKNIRHLFLDPQQELHLHEFYFCTAPAQRALFEPVLVLARKAVPQR